LKGTDFSRLPEEAVSPYDTELPGEDAVLVYDSKKWIPTAKSYDCNSTD
jgi:hypothetical protein